MFPPGSIVYVSYDDVDWGRVEPLVKGLEAIGADRGFTVWARRGYRAGLPSRSSIDQALSTVVSVVVVWTTNSVHSNSVNLDAQKGYQRGVLVPVLLDATARERIPVPFDQFHTMDLVDWDDTDRTELLELTDRIQKLAELQAKYGREAELYATDLESLYVPAVSELSDLTSRLGPFREVLISDSASTMHVRAALKEVGKTYRAVNSAIRRFITASDKKPMKAKPYVDMGYGTLKEDVHNSIGNCFNIRTHYYGSLRDEYRPASEGLRASLEKKVEKKELSEEELDQLDEIFFRLSQADYDLFEQLEAIAEVVSNESKVIAKHLLTGQEDAARQRVVQGLSKLEPVQERLSQARLELQQLQNSLGYTEPVDE